MRLVLRIALPDVPGTLSGVAAALGGCGADIVALEVVARDAGLAVDDVCVESPVGPSHLRRALRAVPGVVVEAVRGVEHFRDVGAAVSLAALLVEAEGPAARLAALLEGLPGALWATWAAAVTCDGGLLRVLGAAGGVPDLDGVGAQWLPLTAPRPLDVDEVLGVEDREPARRAGLALAAAPLDPAAAGSGVVLARVGGPSFRPAELHALGQLVGIAGRAGEGDLLSGRAGRAATAGRS